MSWRWILIRDHEGTFWQTEDDGQGWPVSQTYFFDDDSKHEKSHNCFVSEEFSARKIIKAAERLDPLRCRLYRLVYGSLP